MKTNSNKFFDFSTAITKVAQNMTIELNPNHKTHYEILGVSKSASTEQIRAAYKTKALAYHPDKTGTRSESERKSAEEEFQKINIAHEILTDSTRRQDYDQNKPICFDVDEAVETREIVLGTQSINRIDNNNRRKLTGLSQKVSTVENKHYDNSTFKFTVQFAKSDLMPVLERFKKLVDVLNSKAFKLDNNNNQVVLNEKYEKVANKINELYHEIMININLLRGELINHDDMLRMIKASQIAAKEALNDGEFAIHRGFARNTPILRELCVCLDLIVNFFQFLYKKATNALSGNKTPIYPTMQEFKSGMFKPSATTTARKVDELNSDMAWYADSIEHEYKRAIPLGYKK